jgi:D-aminoacyl-tRNA deacylase
MKIVYSSKVTASAAMAQALSEYGVEVIDTGVSTLIDLDKVEWIKHTTESIVVLSPHKSESGTPCLTVHTPGNWGEARMGGQSFTLNYAMPVFMANYLNNLKKAARKQQLNVNVSYEVDHHGPTITAPITFVEIGSTIKQWTSPAYINAVVEALLNTMDNEEHYDVAVGFGGGHYAPQFTTMTLEKGVAFGHIMPKYHTPQQHTFIQSLEKNTHAVDYVVMDKKGLNAQQRKIIKELAAQYGVELVVKR